jgi:hypothetical protein
MAFYGCSGGRPHRGAGVDYQKKLLQVTLTAILFHRQLLKSICVQACTSRRIECHCHVHLLDASFELCAMIVFIIVFVGNPLLPAIWVSCKFSSFVEQRISFPGLDFVVNVP